LKSSLLLGEVMTGEALMTIGEMAKAAGVAPSTLRYYEGLGLITPQGRASGQRRYDTSALRKLSYVQLAQRAGFSLKEIKTLLEGFPDSTTPSQRWQTLAKAKLLELEALMTQALEMKRVLETGLQCGCTSLETCELVTDLSPAR
jgi:MerR family transcriptional regulator, redox-sensitive transcriptional activator SoxR